MKASTILVAVSVSVAVAQPDFVSLPRRAQLARAGRQLEAVQGGVDFRYESQS